MDFKELVEKANLSQKEVANILGLSINTVSKRINNPNSEVKVRELKLVEDAIGTPLYLNKKVHPIAEYDQVAIKYLQIPGVPGETLRSPYIKERLQFDRELVENAWERVSEYQRIVKMRGDKMHGGDYPLRDNDILMIDTSETNPANSGMYIYTTDIDTHREVFISNVNVRPDGSYRLYYLNNKYEDIIYTSEQLKAMNFTVWGRVVKNLGLTK